MGTRELIERMDHLMEHIEGINDERDSVSILLEMRALWKQLRALPWAPQA